MLTLIIAAVVTAGAVRGQGGDLDVQRNLVFTKTPQKTLSLDLYRPARRAGKLPVVVLIYGGAWMGRFPQGQVGKARWLAGRGYAAAVIDYRLTSEAIFPAQIYDCKAAVRWIRAHAKTYGLDSGHIGAMGDSSGGHLASLLGVTAGNKELEGDGGNPSESSAVQAVVDLFGPTDITRIGFNAVPGSTFPHDTASSPEGRLVGGPVAQHLDLARKASPVDYVTKSAAPFFIAHGGRDTLVPPFQSKLLFDALKRAGVEVTYYLVAGAGHEDPQFDSDMMRGAIGAFLDKHLKSAGSGRG